jgi:riboflavin-specific deaminase-like protein
MTLTHQLRADHDAILVGIGTVLADDPALTVRLVAGTNPRPVILDSDLRTPPTARVLAGAPWIATRLPQDDPAADALRRAGADIATLPQSADHRLDLPALLTWLHRRGIRSLMVEGGARVLTAFLAARLADRLIITIAPRLVGGVHGVVALPEAIPLHAVRYESAGDDLILYAHIGRS